MVSDKDRAHFALIAAVAAEEEDERITRALSVPPGVRMMIGWELGRQCTLTPAHLAEIDAQADGQMELARRRIAMNLESESLR